MRRLFTTAEATASGLSDDALAWGVRKGAWVRIMRSVYGHGPHQASAVDVARARVLSRRSVARGHLAGVLHGVDAVELDDRPTRRDRLAPERIVAVGEIPCADGFTTLVDLAATLDDARWEQALESALRKRLTTVAEMEAALPSLARARTPGVGRMRRVLARRPPGAPPTESPLETIAVQVARAAGLGELTRQHRVHDDGGLFVARVDLCDPALGFFLELDGQHHAGQPVYDAARETAVVAATGWLCGRFTWREMVRTPRTSARRMGGIASSAGAGRCTPPAQIAQGRPSRVPMIARAKGDGDGRPRGMDADDDGGRRDPR